MVIDDDIDRALDEENPGPSELESRLVHDTLASVVSHPPLITEPETSLADALRQMREHRRGYILLVATGGRLAGIFTERDVLMKVAGKQIDLAHTPVSAYMTGDLVTLPSDAVVAFALNRMVVEGFRHIPIVDGLGRPVGVVSMRDIIDYLSEFYRSDVLNLPPNPGVASRKRDGA
jgi:CBS domain-containing protein